MHYNNSNSNSSNNNNNHNNNTNKGSLEIQINQTINTEIEGNCSNSRQRQFQIDTNHFQQNNSNHNNNGPFFISHHVVGNSIKRHWPLPQTDDISDDGRPYSLFTKEIFGHRITELDADTNCNEFINTNNYCNNVEAISSEVAVPAPLPQLTTPSMQHICYTMQNFWLELLPKRLSMTALSISILLTMLATPRLLSKYILFPIFRLSFGTLYPAYASYKAVRTKSVKEYVKWMMYWIVYAFFTCFETVTDIFFSWFPFYYEIKVIIVLWLLSPATKGSSTLYRKFVHPALARHEQNIDEYLNQAKERGYTAVVQLGAKGVNYATNLVVQTAIKGGGNLVQTIRRSYSLSDLSEPDVHRSPNEVDEVLLGGMPLQAQLQQQVQPRLLRNRLPASIGQQHQHRSTSGTRHSTGMYYTEAETDLAMTAKAINEYYNTIRYPSDISSGYSSAADTTSIGLSRTASMSSTSKQHRIKPKRQEDKLLSTSYTTLPRSKKAEAKANANANIAIANSANKLRIKHDK